MAEWPPSLKPITKFMARAREVEKSDPIISYYCNFYSLTRALQLRDTSDDAANQFVRGLLEKCETQKESIGPDDGSHQAKVEEFALSIFDRADTEDRADKATKATALTFYAAACFLEVCSIFGKLSSDIEERLRYAKWKAADITKALREGRKPIPGAPGEAEARAKAEAEAEAERTKAEAETQEKTEVEQDVVPIDHVSPKDESTYDQPSAIPPAPPVREYETETNDDSGAPNGLGDAPQYPNVDVQYPVAPKYPSSDAPSPLAPKAAAPSYPTLDINAPPRSHPPPSLDISAPMRQAAPPAPTLDISAPMRQAAPPVPSLDINAPQRPPAPSLDINAPPRPPAPSLDIHAPPRQMAPPTLDIDAPPRKMAPPTLDIDAPPRKMAPPTLDIDAPPKQTGPSPPALFIPGQNGNGTYNDPAPPTQFKPPIQPSMMDPPAAPGRVSALGPAPGPAPLTGPTPSPAPVQEQAPAAVQTSMPAPVVTAPAPAPAPAPVVKKVDPNYKPSIKQTQEAQRLAKYAASALDFQDLKTAVSNLEDALALLTGQQRQ